MHFDFVWTLLISLGLTIILELVFALILIIREANDLILVIVVNVITNPAVVLLSYLLLKRTNLPQIPSAVGSNRYRHRKDGAARDIRQTRSSGRRAKQS